MNIVEEKTENGITLVLDGKIDKISSTAVQSAILTAVAKNGNLTIDFAKVDYISSAGLRALLLGQKSAAAKGGKMKLINVGESVLSILKLSGFDKILSIE